MSDLSKKLRWLADEADEDWNTPGHADWRLTAASRLIGLSSTLARCLADEHEALKDAPCEGLQDDCRCADYGREWCLRCRALAATETALAALGDAP